MNDLSLDLDKHGLAHLKEQPYPTDEDIEKLIGAFVGENLSPKIRGVEFCRENVERLLNLSKCRRCGKCCLPNRCNPDNPGIFVDDSDLELISKKTNHNLKSLRGIAKVNDNPVYTMGARYFPQPCLFFNKTERGCKIYPYRPFVCTIFPILYDNDGEFIVDLWCDYGKDIYREWVRRQRIAES
jgi:Fe-S-cluster containining protein